MVSDPGRDSVQWTLVLDKALRRSSVVRTRALKVSIMPSRYGIYHVVDKALRRSNVLRTRALKVSIMPSRYGIYPCSGQSSEEEQCIEDPCPED